MHQLEAGGNEALSSRWRQFKTWSDGESLYQDDALVMRSWNRWLNIDYPGHLIVPGCEWHISPPGRSYFINHNTRTTLWKKPKPECPAGSLMPECVIEGHSGSIWDLAHLGASGNIMSASEDGPIRQWKRDGEPVGKLLNSNKGKMASMAVSPDETTIIHGSLDGSLRLWNIKEGSMIGDLWEEHDAAVRCLDWSCNALEIASGSKDGTIQRWNADTGRQIAPLIETSHGLVEAVKYSPQGDKFASGGVDMVICVWSRDGKLLIEIKGHIDVMSLCWSKDGAHIFNSGSGEHTVIRKWRAIDGRQLVFYGHTHPNQSNPSVLLPTKAILLVHQGTSPFASGISSRQSEIHSCMMISSWLLSFPPIENKLPVLDWTKNPCMEPRGGAKSCGCG